MKFTGKWMELTNIIMNKVSGRQKNTHCMYSLISADKPKAQKTQNKTYKPYGAEEEGRPKCRCFNST